MADEPKPITGKADVTLGGVTVSAAGGKPIEGTGAITLGPVTLEGRGEVKWRVKDPLPPAHVIANAAVGAVLDCVTALSKLGRVLGQVVDLTLNTAHPDQRGALLEARKTVNESLAIAKQALEEIQDTYFEPENGRPE